MTAIQWAVAVMILLSFVSKTTTVFHQETKSIGARMIVFIIVIGWYAALMMLLHGGGFW
jgi:hypothetical protein